MFNVFSIIFFMAVAIVITLAITKKIQFKKITWLLAGLGSVTFYLAFEVLLNSFAEYESKAGLLGFGVFMFLTIIFVIVAWRVEKLRTKENINEGEVEMK